jgi:hypothetical protein
MKRRKSNLYAPVNPGSIVVSAEHAKPAGHYSKGERWLLWLGILIIVLGALYIAVLLFRHHRSGQVPAATPEQHQRVQQSPQDNSLDTTTPRSSVSNGATASPTR